VKRSRSALIVLIASLLVLAVGFGALIVSQRQAQEQADIPTVGSRDLASLAAAASPSPTMSSASPSASGSAPPSPSQAPSPPVLSAPVRVRIPQIGVKAEVLPVGLDRAKAVAIPEDIMKVGWYELGVPPGASQGSAVLVAHRDGRVQGHGVFYNLGQLGLGDKVFITTSAGEKLSYKVVSRELISKKRLPLEELFAIDGPPRLTLISCGGYYDRNNGGYQDNVVVTAVPTASVTS
jgi:LPXTG-site transpeptidase (sortase) family protein